MRWRGLGWRYQLGIALLLAQLGAVAYARFVPTRYFAWAPNDYAVEYRIAATVDGRALTPQQVQARYRLDSQGLYEFPPQMLIDDLRGYERQYGERDHVRLRLTYRLDGHDLEHWRYTG